MNLCSGHCVQIDGKHVLYQWSRCRVQKPHASIGKRVHFNWKTHASNLFSFVVILLRDLTMNCKVLLLIVIFMWYLIPPGRIVMGLFGKTVPKTAGMHLLNVNFIGLLFCYVHLSFLYSFYLLSTIMSVILIWNYVT